MTNETKNQNVLEQLELVEVATKDGKAVMTFLDEDAGEIREVNFNKKVYDKDKEEFVDDDEKAAKVEQWAKDYFGVSFDKLPTAEGQKHDIHVYDNFNSLWEVDIVAKFEKADEGLIFDTEIEDIVDDGVAIHIYFRHDGKKYDSKMTYAEYLESKKQFFPNPQKKTKQYRKFEDKFGVPVEKADEIISNKIMCEVKVAFSKFPYVEIKKPRW